MWVHTGSGITSRCQVLADAYYMVKEKRIGKKLMIIWPVSKECRISYYDVFDDAQFSDIPHRVIELRRGAVISEREENFIAKGGAKFYLAERNFSGAFYAFMIELKLILSHIGYRLVTGWFQLKKSYFDYTPPKEVGWAGEGYRKYIDQTWQNIREGLACGRDMYVNAGAAILRDKEHNQAALSCIRFKEEYWNAVKGILGGGEGQIVGVHIRRTDHNTAIAESRTEDFMREMDRILEEDPAAHFFLATDDPQEEEKLKERYGSKIITMEHKDWGRNSVSGMKCGIIDVLCLSQCRLILGSYTSVFSGFAARYGKCDLIICKSE